MASALPPAVEVIVVGAGPSGLACAASLAARNVPFILVDARPEGHSESRAVGMHANSMEVFDAIDPRLPQEILQNGIVSKSINMVDKEERPVFSLRLDALAQYTKYPFIVLIRQHDLERVIRTHLQRVGHDVRWNSRVVGLNETEDGGAYEVVFEHGERVKAQYVVGADGSRSTIRTLAGIRYLNPHTGKESAPSPSDPSFVVADVIFASPVPENIPRDTFRIGLNSKGMVLTAPIDPKRPEFFRLYMGVPDAAEPLDAEALQAILNERGPGSHISGYDVPRVVEVLSSARFRTRPALAERFVQRSSNGHAYAVLIGDSAHKHGPAGGQGMNLGICEAYALAESIQRHRETGEKGTDDATVFDQYNTKRRKIAAAVVDMVEGMTTVEAGEEGWIPWLRLLLLGTAFSVPFINRAAAWNISGLGYWRK